MPSPLVSSLYALISVETVLHQLLSSSSAIHMPCCLEASSLAPSSSAVTGTTSSIAN
jgi:hypothetical protein